jgi:hypothetical protein
MPLVINSEKLRGELNNYFRWSRQPLSDVRLTERILLEACPIIEERLANSKYLKQFTWNGKQAFYDDEPFGKREIRTKGAESQHMVMQFHVTPNVGAKGYGGFVIHNDKEVYSSHGKFNLFDLLWYGFGPYIGPDPYKKFERLSYTEIAQMGWRRRKKWVHGTTIYHETPMNFYYRYAGKWFYNRTKRGGFTPSLHDKFKEYIMGAVEYGIEMAVKNIIESGEGTDAMKTIWNDVRGRS